MIPLGNNSLFFGIVEDVNDPMRIGRVRVRCFKIHTDNKAQLPTEMLPWATVGGSIYSASISGVGEAPVGMVPGTMVYGLFLDGDAYQEPFVLGTAGGFRETYLNETFGFNDPKGEYPRKDVAGDVNTLAGGAGNTQAMMARKSNATSGSIPESFDATNPPPQLNPDAFKKSAPWMPFAQSNLGVNEADNVDKIKEFHKVGGGVSREASVAWCSAFANWCLVQAGIGGTNSAVARSFLNYGTSVGKDNVPMGAIAVFGVPNSGSGHVAFVLEDKGDKLVCIGGNQSDKSHRSGGQVSKTTIPKNGSSLVLLDCRMPTNLNQKT